MWVWRTPQPQAASARRSPAASLSSPLPSREGGGVEGSLAHTVAHAPAGTVNRPPLRGDAVDEIFGTAAGGVSASNGAASPADAGVFTGGGPVGPAAPDAAPAEEPGWVWPWDTRASWNPYDTLSLWTGTPKSEFVHGAGLIGSANAELGIAAGGGVTLDVGAGAFTGGYHVGGFAGGGAFVGGPHGPTLPGSKSAHGVIGAFAGAGGGAFLTNANEVAKLRGAFDTCSLNVGIGPVKGSVQIGISGGTWIMSVTFGPGLGADVTRYPTITITTP